MPFRDVVSDWSSHVLDTDISIKINFEWIHFVINVTLFTLLLVPIRLKTCFYTSDFLDYNTLNKFNYA